MKYFSVINLIFIFFFSVSATAGLMKIGTVTAILTSQKTAEIQLDTGVNLQTAENVFIGTKQTNCEAKVTKQTAKIFLVDLTSCTDSSNYAVNSEAYIYSEDYTEQVTTQQTIPPQPSALPQQPEILPTTEKNEFTNLGVGFRLNNSLKFEDVQAISGATTEGSDVEYESDSAALFIEINHINAQRNAWGWMAGLSYWTVEWDKVKAFGSTITNNTTESTILNGAGSLVYRFTDGFLQFGFNLSSISTKNSPFLEVSKGSLGAQLGGGVFINKHLMLAIESKVITYSSVTYWQGSDSLTAKEPGFYSGLNLGLYFTFN